MLSRTNENHTQASCADGMEVYVRGTLCARHSISPSDAHMFIVLTNPYDCECATHHQLQKWRTVLTLQRAPAQCTRPTLHTHWCPAQPCNHMTCVTLQSWSPQWSKDIYVCTHPHTHAPAHTSTLLRCGTRHSPPLAQGACTCERGPVTDQLWPEGLLAEASARNSARSSTYRHPYTLYIRTYTQTYVRTHRHT